VVPPGATTGCMTARLRHILLVAAILAAAIVGSSDAAATPHRPVHVVAGFSDAQLAVIDWAVARFHQAGLRLPPVELVRHNTVEPCFGASGAHVFEDGRSTVHICIDEPRKTLVLHELAHAWERATLDDGRRHAFLQTRGLAEWRDARWHERGTEHAAEAVMWGLMDVPLRIVTIRDTSCGRLRAAFVMLTGREPLRDGADLCR
jgi:hypothetical protein